jgi:prenyltransferase beta subunit
MRVQVKVVIAWNKVEVVEDEVSPNIHAGELKRDISKRVGLIPDEHLFQMIVIVPMPGTKELNFDKPTGKLKETGNLALVSCPRTLKDDRTLQEQDVSETSELVLVWAPEAIQRCSVCGLKMRMFFRDYGFGGYWDLLLCSNCNRADWVSVGRHNEFVTQWTAPILYWSGNILLVKREETVELYELFGEKFLDTYRYRHFTLSEPDLDLLQKGTFKERLTELLQSQVSPLPSFNYRTKPERIHALHLLGTHPRDSNSVCTQILVGLAGVKELPGPGRSACALLSYLSDSLEVLDALDFSIDFELRDRLRDLILRLRNPDGGWAHEITLVHDKNGEFEEPPGWRFRIVPRSDSQVHPTFLALKALGFLSVELVDGRRTVGFLRGCQMEDGGCSEGGGCVRRSFLPSTFEAVQALALLDAVPKDVEGGTAWLRGHQTVGGGFADDPVEMNWGSLIVGGKNEVIKPRISLRNTIHAVKALETLHSSPSDQRACIEYVLSQRSRFGFGDVTSSDTFNALSVIASLDGLPNRNTCVNQEYLIDWPYNKEG